MATSTAPLTRSDEIHYLTEVVGGTARKPVSWFRDDLSPEYMGEVTLPERSEVRAVERGRNARIARDDEGRIVGFDVHSDTHHRSYRVTIVGASSLATYFGCNCPSGIHRPGQPVPCFHAAAVARSLARRGLLRQDGPMWVPTELTYDLGLAVRQAQIEDPCAGLGQVW